MKFSSDSQRKAVFSNLNRFAAVPTCGCHRGAELVGSSGFSEKSVGEQYKELDAFLKSRGMTWEDYMAVKPVPDHVHDEGVPTPMEEYLAEKKRKILENRMSNRSIEDIKFEYDNIWELGGYDESLKAALKFLRRQEKSKRDDVRMWAHKEIANIYDGMKTAREEARMEDPSKGADADYFRSEDDMAWEAEQQNRLSLSDAGAKRHDMLMAELGRKREEGVPLEDLRKEFIAGMEDFTIKKFEIKEI